MSLITCEKDRYPKGGNPGVKREGFRCEAIEPGPGGIRPPFSGMFSSPCGVWIRLDTFASGAVWSRLCRGATMRGIFGAAL